MAKANYNYSTYQNGIKGLKQKLTSSSKAHIVIAWGPCEYLLYKVSQHSKTIWDSSASSSALTHEGSMLAKEGLSAVFEQAGLFAQQSMHIVKRAQGIKDLPKKLDKLGSLETNNHIVFCIETNKRPEKLFKQLSAFNPTEVPCHPPKVRELQSFLFNLFTEAKVNVEQKAAQLILQSIGDDLFALENAVNKISLEFADQSEPITYNQIAASIGVMREDHAFKLVNHIIDGKKAQAQILIEDLIERGTEPLSILGIITRHIKNAIQLSGSNASASYLPQFVKKQYSGYTRKVSKERLKLALVHSHKMDVSIKSNSKYSSLTGLSQLISIL